MMENIIRFRGRGAEPAFLRIGNERDNFAEHIQFVLPTHLEGASAFLYLHIGDYSDVVNLGADRIYTPTRTHTQYPGKWEAYLQAQMNGDVVWHSDVFTLYVGTLPHDGERIEQVYPAAIEEALKAVDTLTGMDAKAETLDPGSEATVSFEEDAEGNRTIVYGIPRGRDGSGSSGGENGEDGGYYKPAVSDDGDLSWTPSKSGMPSVPAANIKGPAGADGAAGPAGADGYSPTITTTAINGGHRITITDVNGTQTINVWDGKDGSGDGTGGSSGADGYSPTITVTAIDGGHRLTITDVNGSRAVDVMDGVEGEQGPRGAAGPAGADGYTPVKGTDYWTAEDQQGIIDAVLTHFVDASEVAM